MRLVRPRLLAVLLALGLGVAVLPAAPAAAHSGGTYHYVTMRGTIKLHDDETWPISDEEKTFSVLESDSTSYSPKTGADIDFENTCCGEIRAVLDTTGYVSSTGTVRITGKLKLYEGVCESWVCNNDLDGVGIVDVSVAYGASKAYTLKVNNTDEGGDWIYLSVTFTNTH